MGFFKKKREKSGFIDLTKNSNLPSKKFFSSPRTASGFEGPEIIDLTNHQANTSAKEQESLDARGFFGAVGNSVREENSGLIEGDSPEEKRRKLAKRLMDMTKQIEELSNQVYKLQQRIEVLERKSNGGNFESVF